MFLQPPVRQPSLRFEYGVAAIRAKKRPATSSPGYEPKAKRARLDSYEVRNQEFKKNSDFQYEQFLQQEDESQHKKQASSETEKVPIVGSNLHLEPHQSHKRVETSLLDEEPPAKRICEEVNYKLL